MSCQLSVLSGFQDIKAVRQFLFPFLREHTPEVESANSVTEVEVSDEWNNDWGWSEDEQAIQKAVESLAGNNEVEDNSKMKWLQDCLISLSPANDMITLAFENRIIVLTQKWDPKNNEEDIDTKFTIAWKSEFTPSELITAVLCLPLASQKRSTHGAPDWTCVIVGYSNGYIKMFTETGVLLLSQLLHAEQIQKIKAHTYEPPRYLGMAEQHEELVILYRKAVVSIDGFSLMQSLRACRNQVARATASGGESVLQVPPLAYKKWGLQDQDIIHDHISCGLQSSNAFDQMKTASLLGGYAAGVKSSPPAATIYVTSGVGPYVGFFYAVEGSAPPILSEVAMAMAHKIKSALMSAASGWLGFGGKTKDDSKDKHVPKIEQATPLPLRFSLPDRRRTGNKIVLSPNSHYAAVTGSFGRVILIDVERGIAVRIWKGYRDAQVGWIMIREDDGHSGRNPEHSRVAQFLIIYAPRRGILEVWTAANGPRVAAFNVSKWCQLVCPSYGVMGLNNVTCQGTKHHSYQCALIDTDGVIKIIDIPFHLALSDKSSKRARDLHLLKKLKALLKETTEESEAVDSTITELILDIRIANIAKQGVERILAAKYLSPKFMKSVIKACIKKISGKGDINQDIDSRLFLRYCQSQDCLLQSYNMIQGFSTSTNSPDTSPECLCRLLGVTPSELESIQSSLDSNIKTTTATPDKRVQFKDNNSTLPITSYLRCFECQVHLSDHDASKFTSISVIKSLSSDRRLALATFIFDRCICGSVSSSDLSVMLQDSNLPPDDIMSLLLLYWLSNNERYIWSIPNLHHVIKSITAMTDKSDVLVDNNAISSWWQKVRDQCSHSDHIQSAYIAALTCKGVATEMLGNQTKAKDPDADTASCNSDKTDLSEWESLAVDMEHWNVLVKQLDDVLAISRLLQLKLPTNQHSNVTKLEPITVSVTKLLEGGRGSISEIVARYAMRLGLGPRSLYRKLSLVNNHTDDSSQQITETDIDAEEEVKTPLEQIQDQLEVLRERFPHSLENDILLSNCCWEYAAQWNREPEIVKNLELSVEYLKLVQNALLRQGVCSLLWHMFILKRFSATAYLMDKVGKVPKERLCRKDIGMSDTDLLSFIGSTADVLQITMDANCEANEVPVFNLEILWQSSRGPASLSELAVDQKNTNYGLLKHHLHLARIIQAILVFNIKSTKVLSLFDTKGKNAFFKELHSHPLLPNQNVDANLSNSRTVFLCRVISQAVQTLEIPGADTSGLSSPSKRAKTAAVRWPDIALDLGKEFGLDIDYIKQCHVRELYSGGHDKLAEEILPTVNDHERLGYELLTITGQRMFHYLFEVDPPGAVNLIADLSTSLSTWLKSMDSTLLRKPNVPLDDTATLIGHATSNLPEGSTEYETAISLVEVIQALK